MKLLVAILFVLVALLAYLLYQQHPPDRTTVQIAKVKDGYDVYYNGELRLEFTGRNCDSASLRTLGMLHTIEEW